MSGWLAAKLGPRAGETALWLVLALLVAAVLALTYCSGGKDAQIAQQKADAKVDQKVDKADAKAAEQRVEDAVRLEQQEKELDDAVKADHNADRTRALRGCVIMRQQGRDTSKIPACRGS